MSKISIDSLLNSKVVMFLLIVPFFEPFGTEDMAHYIGGGWQLLHVVFTSLKWISFTLTILLSFKRMNNISKIILLLVVYQIWIVLRTVFNGGISIGELSTIICTISSVLLFDYYIQYGDTAELVELVEKILLFWIVLNLFTVIGFPKGMYVDDRGWASNWILGYRNIHIYYYIPFLSISAINRYIRQGRLNIVYFLSTVCIGVSAYLSGSITTLISVIILIVLAIIFGDHHLPKYINYITAVIASVIFSVMIIVYGIQYRYSDLLRNLLGKDTTFSSRTLIWSRAILDALKHPIIGNGLVSYDGIFANWTVSQMHNMYLDILLIGGSILFVLFCIIVVVLNTKVSQCNCLQLKNIFSFSFIAYSVLFLMEARRDMVLLYIFFVFSYYLPNICEQYYLPEKAEKRVIITFGKQE